PPLFPYTTLFRSRGQGGHRDPRRQGGRLGQQEDRLRRRGGERRVQGRQGRGARRADPRRGPVRPPARDRLPGLMPLARRYAHPEVERRFLLAGVPPGLTGGRLVVDRYLPGTRLRLREVREPGSAVTRKLGQRIREGSGPGRIWHTSLELDEAEWELLCGL